MGNCSRESLLLYAVTDRSWLAGRMLYGQVEEALLGGVTFLQLREKNRPRQEIREEAVALQRLCTRFQVPFIINDDVELAKEVDADGVHVGQGDMDVRSVRQILGPDKIIGVSAKTPHQAQLAQAQGADYLGVGAVFQTGTKQDASTISYQQLKSTCASVSIPAVAIGGITKDNLKELAGSGVCGIAVVSAIFAQPDIQKAAAQLKGLAQSYFGKQHPAAFHS